MLIITLARPFTCFVGQEISIENIYNNYRISSLQIFKLLVSKELQVLTYQYHLLENVILSYKML